MLLGAFAKLRKRLLITSCLSVSVSVCPHGTTRLPLDGFSWNLILEYLSNICREYSSLIKIGQEKRVLYMKTIIHFLSYLAHFSLQRNLLQTKFVEKLGTRILRSIHFFPPRKSCWLWDNVEKVCRARQATDNNIAHAHCMLDT